MGSLAAFAPVISAFFWVPHFSGGEAWAFGISAFHGPHYAAGLCALAWAHEGKKQPPTEDEAPEGRVYPLPVSASSG